MRERLLRFIEERQLELDSARWGHRDLDVFLAGRDAEPIDVAIREVAAERGVARQRGRSGLLVVGLELERAIGRARANLERIRLGEARALFGAGAHDISRFPRSRTERGND